MVEVLWCSPAKDWVKCNIDGVDVDSPFLVACKGIFHDDHVNHLISFSAFLDHGSSVLAESMVDVLAIEKAKKMK